MQMIVVCFRGPKGEQNSCLLIVMAEWLLGYRLLQLKFKNVFFFIFNNLATALNFKGEKCAKNRQTVRVLNYTLVNSLLYTYLGLMKQ